MIKCWRQGDVLIKEFWGPIPEDLKEKKDKVLAEGEVTGHSHRIISGDAVLLINPNGFMLLRVKSEQVELYHEEHESIMLPMGDWEIGIQREWDWFNEETRKVVD